VPHIVPVSVHDPVLQWFGHVFVPFALFWGKSDSASVFIGVHPWLKFSRSIRKAPRLSATNRRNPQLIANKVRAWSSVSPRLRNADLQSAVSPTCSQSANLAQDQQPTHRSKHVRLSTSSNFEPFVSLAPGSSRSTFPELPVVPDRSRSPY
jgi:hypothetical protein